MEVSRTIWFNPINLIISVTNQLSHALSSIALCKGGPVLRSRGEGGTLKITHSARQNEILHSASLHSG